MLSPDISITPGTQLTSPGGRLVQVCDVFVPRNHAQKGRDLPASFRSARRKVVVFSDGSLASLADVRRCFCGAHSHASARH